MQDSLGSRLRFARESKGLTISELAAKVRVREVLLKHIEKDEFEKVGADVETVRRGMGSDARIGKRFLFPGIGYGGSCFPKDVQALAKTSQQFGYEFSILNSVMEVNDKQKIILVKGKVNSKK